MAKKRAKKASAARRSKGPSRSASKRSAGRKSAGARRAPSKASAPRQRGIPPGMHTVTPQLVFRGAARAIEFYKQAFGAREVMRMSTPDGSKIMHAELRIGDSVIFVNDEHPQSPIAPASLNQKPTASMQLYVTDCDAVFQSAVTAGARVTMPLTDMFWGDRYGVVADPFGQFWGISTHVKDVSPEEMRRAAEEWAAKNVPPQPQPG